MWETWALKVLISIAKAKKSDIKKIQPKKTEGEL